MSFQPGLKTCSIIALQLIISGIAVFAHRNSEKDVVHTIWVYPSRYRLRWSVNYKEEQITFEVAVRTNGWIGLGILRGHKKTQRGADIWIGWVDKKGRSHMRDCHGSSDGYTTLDVHNNLHLVGHKRGKELTVLKFKRDIATFDDEDIQIKEGLHKFIFAWSTKSPDTRHPCKSFQNRHVHMRFKTIDILHKVRRNRMLPPRVRYFDLVHRKVKVPAKRTTYWCTNLRLADVVHSKRHIVAIEPLIQERKKDLIHHMVLHSCYAKPNEQHATFSMPCYQDDVSTSEHDCAMLGGMYAWAAGMSTFYFPENVGYPIDADNGSHYFMLQVHFNNDLLRNDIVDTSGLRLYYATPRKYEAGMLTVGAVVNDDMIIPPGMSNWTIGTFCGKRCTQKMHPTKKIKLFASFPHGHSKTIKMKTIIVRNGTEVDEVISINDYDGNHQHFKRLEKEVEVREGDEIFTYCTYRTLGKKYAITGGKGSDKEMCLNFIMYYPKMGVETCLSSEIVTQPVFTTKYAKPVYAHCAVGEAPSEDASHWRYSNWTGVEWTASMKKELYNFYNTNNPRPLVQVVCRGRSGVKYDLPLIYRPIVKRKSQQSGFKSSLKSKKKRTTKGAAEKSMLGQIPF